MSSLGSCIPRRMASGNPGPKCVPLTQPGTCHVLWGHWEAAGGGWAQSCTENRDGGGSQKRSRWSLVWGDFRNLLSNTIPSAWNATISESFPHRQRRSSLNRGSHYCFGACPQLGETLLSQKKKLRASRKGKGLGRLPLSPDLLL